MRVTFSINLAKLERSSELSSAETWGPDPPPPLGIHRAPAETVYG